MIREGALVRAMKAAYKSEGYTVTECEGGGGRRYIIAGAAWLIACDAPLLPRKALSLIAEHLGALQHDEAFRVRKDEEPQRIMPDAQIALYCDYYGKRRTEMYKTRLTLDGLELWQEKQGNDLMLMDAELSQIATVTESWAAVRSEDALTVDTGAEFVAIVRVRDDRHGGLERLKNYHWEE